MSWRQKFSQIKTLMGIMHGSRAFGGPLQASISLTNRCNIRCIHCYFYSPFIEGPNLYELRKARLKNQELPDSDYLRRLQKIEADSKTTRNLIDNLISMGTRKFFFSGSGEPFLHKNVLEFMSRAKNAGSTCIVNTNGTLLDRTIIDELIKMRFDDLKITTLSGSQDMYIKTHPGVKHDTFDKLRNNLYYLSERKTEIGVKYPEVSLIFIVIPQNYNDIFKFVEFAKSVNADRVIFRPVDTADDPGLKKFIVPTVKQAEHVKDQLSEAEPYLESLKISNNIGYFFKAFRNKLDTRKLYRVIPCYYGWLGTRFDVGGQVHPCCRCYEPLGNVYEKDFHEIWNGDAYLKFRKEAIQINRRKVSVCGCNCNCCPHFTANLMVYKRLHPIKGLTTSYRNLSPFDFTKERLN